MFCVCFESGICGEIFFNAAGENLTVNGENGKPLIPIYFSALKKSAKIGKIINKQCKTGVTLFLELLMEFPTVNWDSNIASIFGNFRIFRRILPGSESVQIVTKWL